ncbi:hypothetical protein ATANTOWER_000997 [Ataeniobius toweri]|uniref:Uncharacterized protein n=1 Tax=Ataeniobius toweri TaxID=208326 RepID=A0ABU7AWB5_9TELE|nr:hypothetical protein [Ataeniobius toweri]
METNKVLHFVPSGLGLDDIKESLSSKDHNHKTLTRKEGRPRSGSVHAFDNSRGNWTHKITSSWESSKFTQEVEISCSNSYEYRELQIKAPMSLVLM